MDILIKIISRTLFRQKDHIDNTDEKREKIFNILKEHGFTVSQTEHSNFYKFILESYNTICYQKFIVLCCGMYDEEETFKLLNKIINKYYSRNDIICFHDLYKLDKEWYEFFKENTKNKSKMTWTERADLPSIFSMESSTLTEKARRVPIISS